MINIIRVVAFLLILGLFIYSKLLPHESKLKPKWGKVFRIIKSIFQPILHLSNKFFHPYQVGYGISIDISQLILLIILLIILIF